MSFDGVQHWDRAAVSAVFDARPTGTSGPGGSFPRRSAPSNGSDRTLPSPLGAVAERGDHDFHADLYPAGKLRPAAVLIPLIERSHGLNIVLTRRTEHLHHHAGQVSFPGGRVEEKDRDVYQTALRETEEEVGFGPDAVSIIGRLDTYITRTGFEITPVVGFVASSVQPVPDPFEVAEVFEVPLSFVTNPANHEIHSRIFKGNERQFYVIPYEDYYIWGATAGMLVNLSDVLLAPSHRLG